MKDNKVLPSKHSSKTQYRFTCNISDIDIFMYVDNIDLLFDKNDCTVVINMRNPRNRKMLYELTEYAKKDHTNSVLAVEFLDSAGESVESVVLNKLQISNISTKLNYSNDAHNIIQFHCKGEYVIL